MASQQCARLVTTQRVTKALVAIAAISCWGTLTHNTSAAGVVILKRLAWEHTVAEIREFSSQRARRPHENGDQSYFLDRKGHSFGVETSLILRIIPFPDPAHFPNITSDESLGELLSKGNKLEAETTKFPQIKPYLNNITAALDAEVTRYRSGDRKVDGRWLSSTQYSELQGAISARRAAEEKRRADARAAAAAQRATAEAERMAAQQRAREVRAAEQQQLLEQKLADQQRREQAEAAELMRPRKATAELQVVKDRVAVMQAAAAESYLSADKGVLSGQVFIATKGSENFKLGAVEIGLFHREVMEGLLVGLRQYAVATSSFATDHHCGNRCRWQVSDGSAENREFCHRSEGAS